MRASSQSGQMTVEMVLIMIALTGFALLVGRGLGGSGMLQKLVSAPWTNLRGMIESGVWAPPAQAAAQHPNLKARHATVQGDLAQ